MVTWEWEKHLSCIFKHNLPLTYCRLFFLSSFYLNFSSREKLQKRPALQKQSFCALFRSCKQHPSVTQNLPQTTFRSVIGDKRTRFSRNNGNINMHRSNRLLSCFRCLNGCLLCFRQCRRFLGITYANEKTLPLKKDGNAGGSVALLSASFGCARCV